VIDEVRKLIARWQRKIAVMIARGIIQYVDDGHGIQLVNLTVQLGDVWTGVQRFQQYGFTSVPQQGAEAAVVSVAGLRSFGIVIATDDRRYRPQNMQPGDSAQYDSRGQMIRLSSAGIAITGVGLPISISNVPQVKVTGGDVICDGISLKTHVHSGVQTGSGNTGAPVAS
jgi:phage baseplate assembly protein V